MNKQDDDHAQRMIPIFQEDVMESIRTTRVAITYSADLKIVTTKTVNACREACGQ